MKKFVLACCAMAILGTSLGACAYAGVATSGDKAVIARNDSMLYGALRKVFVCQITDAGLSNCVSNESP